MAEANLRRNLEVAFDPGPGFPDRLLLSRTMAALAAADPAARRQTARVTRRRSLGDMFFLNTSSPGGRVVAAALIALLVLAAIGAFVFIQHYYLSPTPARWSGCG